MSAFIYFSRALHLSDHEIAVLQDVAKGKTDKEIAQSVHRSEHTIKSHVRSAMGKLSARTRAQAVAEGLRYGMID